MVTKGDVLCRATIFSAYPASFAASNRLRSFHPVELSRQRYTQPTPNPAMFMPPLMTGSPSLPHGHLSTRLNGTELRRRNNSFVRITSIGGLRRFHPLPITALITLFRCAGATLTPLYYFDHVKSHERTPNSRRAVKWIDLNFSASGPVQFRRQKSSDPSALSLLSSSPCF